MKFNNKKAMSDIIMWVLIALAVLLVMAIIYGGFSGALLESVSSFSFF